MRSVDPIVPLNPFKCCPYLGEFTGEKLGSCSLADLPALSVEGIRVGLGSCLSTDLPEPRSEIFSFFLDTAGGL